jgi:hypothetical protein
MLNVSCRAWRAALVTGVAATLMVAPPAPAQMLGVPVLQNAFANPGITVAGNFGTQEDARGYGAAAAWSPGSGRFQLSAGAGVFDAETSPDDRTRTFTWGLRGSFSFLELARGAFGLGAFAGAGAFSRDRVTEIRAPIGASVGWRRALGETRAISVYVAPFYSYSERRFDRGGLDCDVVSCPDESERSGALRVSAGVDVAIARSIGITVGYEDGQRAEGSDPGPRSGIFGVGISYAFRRGR